MTTPVGSTPAASVGPTLLDYSVASSPSPLQASPLDTGAPYSTTALDLVACTPPNEEGRLTRIVVVVPVGGGTHDIAAIGEGISAVLTPDTIWEVTEVASDTAVRFTIAPKAGGSATIDALSLRLDDIRVNRFPGHAQILVQEYSSEGGRDPDSVAYLVITKHQYAPELVAGTANRFRALRNNGSRQPATRISAGETVLLEWKDDHDKKRRLYYQRPGGTHTGPDVRVDTDVSDRSTYTVERLYRTTTFTLMTCDDVTGICSYDTATVTVDKPVLNNLLLTGPLGGRPTLTITSDATLGQKLDLAGPLTARTAVAQGPVNPGRLLASTTMSVNGSIDATRITTRGKAVMGDTRTAALTARKRADMLGTPVALTRGLYSDSAARQPRAVTDGFFCGCSQVDMPPISYDYRARFTAGAREGGINVDKDIVPSDSLFLPVKKSELCPNGYLNSNSYLGATYTYHFVPLGN
ncbi:hypothetical protein ACFVSN_30335 [Kitasatospora sp. NPDC057904]|uniref:hypothetical protein n=1 Tax=unclassified Kitasatospora TaxID=2633591 RepID=UPI0036DC410D